MQRNGENESFKWRNSELAGLKWREKINPSENQNVNNGGSNIGTFIENSLQLTRTCGLAQLAPPVSQMKNSENVNCSESTSIFAKILRCLECGVLMKSGTLYYLQLQ